MLLHKMRERGMVANVITFSLAISACDKGAQWEQYPNEADANTATSSDAAFSACEKGEQCEQALKLPNKMPESGMIANVISCNAVILYLCDWHDC